MKVKIKFRRILDFISGFTFILLGIFYTDAESVRGQQLVTIWIISGILLVVSAVIGVIDDTIKKI